MGKILVIEDGKAIPIDKSKFTEEGKLQDYLENYTSLIPLSDISEDAPDLICIGREVGAGPGAIDLLCIDKDGVLTIIETKLRKNRESRREVIGQVIEYASYVSQWAVEDVFRLANDYFAKMKTPPCDTLESLMEQMAGDEFSQNDFRSSIERNLSEGRIRLVIAVDDLIEPLRSTVTFLNEYSSFEILLLQVSSFQETRRTVLIPLLFGYKKSSSKPQGNRVITTLENFFEDARDRCAPDVLKAIEDLYDFTRDNAVYIGFGTGAARRSFIFHGVKKGLSIFTLRSDGTIDNNVGWPAPWRPDYEHLWDFWVSELNSRLETNLSKEDWSITNVEYLVRNKKVEEFKKAVLELCGKIKSLER